MHFSKNLAIKSLLIEMISIIFAVILALIGRDWYENIQKKKEVSHAINIIKTEIIKDRNNLSTSIKSQENFLDTLGIYYTSKFDFSRVKLGFADMLKKTAFNFGITPISTISWETAQYSGIVKEFGFEILSQIAKMNLDKTFIQYKVYDF